MACIIPTNSVFSFKQENIYLLTQLSFLIVRFLSPYIYITPYRETCNFLTPSLFFTQERTPLLHETNKFFFQNAQNTCLHATDALFVFSPDNLTAATNVEDDL